MKFRLASTLLLMMLLAFEACTEKSQPGWQLDVKKSRVFWNTGKVMGAHYGYLLFQSGNLVYSAAGEPVRGTFRMDMNSIRTTDHPTQKGRQQKDAELRATQFFASGEYPVAVMEVKKITRIDSSINYHVAGDLSIKGITHPIEFIAAIDTKNNNAHITAEVNIAHQLWSISQKKDKHRLDSLSAIREKLVAYVHVGLDIVMNQ